MNFSKLDLVSCLTICFYPKKGILIRQIFVIIGYISTHITSCVLSIKELA